MIAAAIYQIKSFDDTTQDRRNADELGLPLLNYQSRRDTLLDFLKTGETFTEEGYKSWLRKINDEEMILVREREYISDMVFAYTGDDIDNRKAPPVTKQAKSFVRALTSHAKSGFKTASKDIIKKRQEVCMSCSELGKDGAMKNRCYACGCYMLVKARWETSKCALGKW